jgi:hypothetical protein
MIIMRTMTALLYHGFGQELGKLTLEVVQQSEAGQEKAIWISNFQGSGGIVLTPLDEAQRSISTPAFIGADDCQDPRHCSTMASKCGRISKFKIEDRRNIAFGWTRVLRLERWRSVNGSLEGA